MGTVLIVGLFCALIFFLNAPAAKPINPPNPEPLPPPQPKRFVSVMFTKGTRKYYDYFIGDNYDLQVNDLVEVPVSGKYINEIKIATVKYVSAPGEVSAYAWATVIRKVPYSLPQPIQPLPQPIQPTPRPTPPINYPTLETCPVEGRFVQVIFKKGSRKRYDYLLGDHNDVRVDDFVLVPIRKSKAWLDKELQRMLIEVEITGKSGQKPRKTTCLRAKVKYISMPGEVSNHAKSVIIKKLPQKNW